MADNFVSKTKCLAFGVNEVEYLQQVKKVGILE
jgi:hypothetical protein